MSAGAALGAAQRVLVPGLPVIDAWIAAENVLQAVTERPEEHGLALVGEARRLNRLSLEDAYHLAELFAAAERARAGEPVASPSFADVLASLENAVQTSRGDPREVAGSPPTPPAPPSPPSASAARSAQTAPTSVDRAVPPSSRRRTVRSAGFILGLLCALILGAAGTWYAFSKRDSTHDFDDGVAAYQRGAREVARIAFARAAQASPRDERPLIFLGRLAREDGNFPGARRFLDAAVRTAPSSGLANRELAAVLLADGNPEMARRFYVRALQLDPTDTLAQGFLGCALFRLGREEEALRWAGRAGTGEWSACVHAVAPPATVPRPAAPTRR